MVIVDASVVIAVAFKEKHGAWAREFLRQNQGKLRMSNVNLFEVLIVIRFRQPHMYHEMKKVVLNDLGIEFVESPMEVIFLAADLKNQYPKLNFGDCFVAAHAVYENCALVTLDNDFKRFNERVIRPPSIATN